MRSISSSAIQSVRIARLEHRGVATVEANPAVLEVAADLLGLRVALVGQVGVLPTREAVGVVPGAPTVAHDGQVLQSLHGAPGRSVLGEPFAERPAMRGEKPQQREGVARGACRVRHGAPSEALRPVSRGPRDFCNQSGDKPSTPFMSHCIFENKAVLSPSSGHDLVKQGGHAK